MMPNESNQSYCEVYLITLGLHHPAYRQAVMRRRASFLAGTLCFKDVSAVTLATKYAPRDPACDSRREYNL
jgi:hypothetical protein